ncbi:MAG: ABC transporter substrate-binding protein [Candidatus Thioglobus sp.]|nr:ABC transporter substrate-binding protein [Candidatus Thioglobus sp.]
MFKKLLSLLLITVALSTPTAYADQNPSSAALGIMIEALSSLKQYQSTGRVSFEDVEEVIVAELLPSMDINESARLALKKYWSNLKPKQQLILKTYMATSLVDNYSTIFASYDDLSGVKISVSSKVKRKNNKAIVTMHVADVNSRKSIAVKLKMIMTRKEWHIYDVELSGVSLVKNQKASFNSYCNPPISNAC